MSTITSNINRTLNGSSAFTVGEDTYRWFDRYLDSLSVSAPDDAPLRTVTLTFSGNSWTAGMLRFDGNANVNIKDTTTGTGDDSRVYINYIGVTTRGTSTINLKNAEVEVIFGGGGSEKVTIGYWASHINLNRGDDTVTVSGIGEVGTMDLGRGDDRLTTTGDAWVGSAYFARGEDTVSLGAGGAHFIHLGQDADRIKFSADTQSTIAHGGEGISDDVPGAKDSDTVDFSAFSKGLFIDLNGRSFVEGTAGDYLISNFENAIGGKGKDTIIASEEVNILKGGTNADIFVFQTTKAAKGDKILDFSQVAKDRIDLSDIDANTSASGNQTFKFIGAVAFHKTEGELRYEKKSGDTLIHGDVNGDGKADFTITLDTSLTLKSGDFIL
jgi:serralysin